MSIAASEKGLPSADADDSAGQPSTVGAAQSEADAELAAMLLQAAKGIGVEVSKAPSPKRSQLDDWSALAAKAYGAAGQAASALHEMAILQVYQAKALRQLHKGSSDPGLMQEL
ncbi:hypothetical protein M9458_025778, partial [Cirrhinus mrigala]